MSDKFSDHDIVGHYHQGATEQPSVELDQHILQLAAESIKPLNISSINKPILKKKHLYQTWYGQLSTAASLVFVAVLYLQNDTVFYEPSSHSSQDTKQSAPQSATQSSSKKLNQNNSDKIFESNKLRSAPVEQLSIDSITDNIDRRQMKKSYKEEENNTSEMLKDQISINHYSESASDMIENEASNDILIALNKVDLLLTQGETTKATEALSALLAKYPELTLTLDERYKKLLAP